MNYLLPLSGNLAGSVMTLNGGGAGDTYSELCEEENENLLVWHANLYLLGTGQW